MGKRKPTECTFLFCPKLCQVEGRLETISYLHGAIINSISLIENCTNNNELYEQHPTRILKETSMNENDHESCYRIVITADRFQVNIFT